jgi:hypothetical protein
VPFVETSFLGAYQLTVLKQLEDGTGLTYVFPEPPDATGSQTIRNESSLSSRPLVRSKPISHGQVVNLTDNLIVQVEPVGSDCWTAAFKTWHVPDPSSDWGAHGVVALPDRVNFVACVYGDAYRVRADDPSDWEELTTSTLAHAPIVLPGHELVLFVHFNYIVAWGPHGAAWETDMVVYDDLVFRSTHEGVLVVEGSSPPGTTRTFHVNIDDGSSTMLPLTN